MSSVSFIRHLFCWKKDVAKMCPLLRKEEGKGGQVGIEEERVLRLGGLTPL